MSDDIILNIRAMQDIVKAFKGNIPQVQVGILGSKSNRHEMEMVETEKGDVYKKIKSLRPKAIKRAVNLLTPKIHPENGNPSTTVHQVVEKLISEPGFREED